jgi:hypothetical protein
MVDLTTKTGDAEASTVKAIAPAMRYRGHRSPHALPCGREPTHAALSNREADTWFAAPADGGAAPVASTVNPLQRRLLHDPHDLPEAARPLRSLMHDTYTLGARSRTTVPPPSSSAIQGDPARSRARPIRQLRGRRTNREPCRAPCAARSRAHALYGPVDENRHGEVVVDAGRAMTSLTTTCSAAPGKTRLGPRLHGHPETVSPSP